MINPSSLTSIVPTVSTYAPIETTTCNQQELLDLAESIVTAFINDLSFRILNPAGQSSTATSRTSQTASVGLLLAAMELEDMARILGIPPGELTPELASAIHEVLGRFSREHSFESAGYEKKLVSTLNLLASRNNLGSDDALVEVLSTHYLAKILTPEGNESVADMTDEHVRVATRGLIPELLKGHPSAKSIVTTVTNVMVFDLGWEKELKKGTGPFMTADGETVFIKTMETTDKMGLMIHEKLGLAVIALPFKQEKEQLYLVVIAPLQPSPGAIGRIERGQDLDLLISGALDRQNEEKVKLTLPQISINSTNSELLKQIGSLRGIEITPEMLKKFGGESNDDVSTIQTTIAEIDEKGARGSVATTTTLSTRTQGEDEPFEFNFNSPGLVIIADDKGDRVLEAAIKDEKFLVPSDEPGIIEGAWASSVTTRKILSRRCERCGGAHRGICTRRFTDWKAGLIKRFRQWTGVEESPVKNIPSTSGQPSGDLEKKTKESQLLQALQEKLNGIPIQNVKLQTHEFEIRVKNMEEAEKTNQQLIEFIGKEHEEFITVDDFSNSYSDPRIIVTIKTESKDILIKKLLSKNQEQPSGNLQNIPSTPNKSFDDLTKEAKESQLLKDLEEKFNVHITNIELGPFSLDISTDTKKEAKKIRRRINRFIGEEHKDSVNIRDFSDSRIDPRFEVRLTSNARNILIDKLFPKNRE